MKLSQILSGIAEVPTAEDIEISGLYHNSKEVESGGLFFALEGTKVSGLSYANEAKERGAVAVVSQKDCKLDGIINIKVSDARKAMSLASANFYNNPSKDMLVLGVTGTNGKTTTTFMLESVFKSAGKSVGVIGTNGVFINGKKIGGNLTTPDPIYLQKTLADFLKKGVEVVCMEVSAHALELQKIRGVMTDIALFTNLTQDHLDFFKTMENYERAKAKFFEWGSSQYAVFNVDDMVGRKFFENCFIPSLTYSKNPNLKGDADIIASHITHNTLGQTFDVSTPVGKETIELNLSGDFNVSNALGVIGACLLAGLDLKTIKEGLKKLERVDGRFNTYDVGGVRVIIDYAHTPDGLENILSASRQITEGELFCVFGCGGDRDRSKRPIMGNIATSLADCTIVTSDNPRFERPEDIAKDILSGIKNSSYMVELNRKKAIKLALSLAKPGDSVVIAGKGAENYMDCLGVKTPYEDRQVVEDIINKLGK